VEELESLKENKYGTMIPSTQGRKYLKGYYDYFLLRAVTHDLFPSQCISVKIFSQSGFAKTRKS